MDDLVRFINKKTSAYLRKHYGLNREYNFSLKLRRKKINGVHISEHAIVRYFERVEGYDIEEVMKRIVGNFENKGGVGKYKSGDLILVVDGDTIVTLYKDDSPKVNTARLVTGKGRL